jgi:ketosteroid isomerase-like protein
MDRDEATRFAQRWARDWNARDLDALLTHFSDEVVFTSPIAARIMPGSNGVIRGKDALREYWTEGLRLLPDLRFDVEAVYAGVDTVVIQYRNQTNNRVCEVLTFDGSLVAVGHGAYLADDAAASS